MTDVLTPQQRSFNMSRIRSSGTRPERRLIDLLTGLGVQFEEQGKALPGRPDVVIPKQRKAVFVHGCYWHLHRCRYGKVVPATNAEFWAAKRLSNVKRDRRNLRDLRAGGWMVLTVWECQLRKDLGAVERRLIAFLNPSKKGSVS